MSYYHFNRKDYKKQKKDILKKKKLSIIYKTKKQNSKINDFCFSSV